MTGREAFVLVPAECRSRLFVGTPNGWGAFSRVVGSRLWIPLRAGVSTHGDRLNWLAA
jgi:hypothetical protein